MANNSNGQRGNRWQEDDNYDNPGNWRGQTGGQWGEDIHNTPYNTSGGYSNTQTNYDQGNYDYSRSGDYGFDVGNQYGPGATNENRQDRQNPPQQTSYPYDSFADRRPGNEGSRGSHPDQNGPNAAFIRNTNRNAAYDEANYRSRGNEAGGQPNYGGSGPNSRSSQPGFDHGQQYQNRQGQYEDRQGGYGNDTSRYVRQQDTTGNHRGKGPKGYTRSDARIQEDLHGRLTEDDHLDASDMEVSVENGVVILSGTVENRFAKRHAEDVAEMVSGVKNVENRLRIKGNEAGKATEQKANTENTQDSPESQLPHGEEQAGNKTGTSGRAATGRSGKTK